jgi:hypothetical protein
MSVTPAIDPAALEALFNVIRNYCQIEVFNDAYYRYFSEDYFTKYVQEDLVKYTSGSLADSRSAQAYAGPQGASPFYDPAQISGNPMPADEGSIAVDAAFEEDPQTGTYFRSTYVDFKRLGYMTAINPRWQDRYQILKKTTMWTGFTNIFKDDKTWKYQKINYKRPYWQLNEELGVKEATQKFPPPVTVASSGQVLLRTRTGYGTHSEPEIVKIPEDTGCYFISPSILNVLARRGIQFRDMSKAFTRFQAHKAPEFAARAELYVNLYASLMDLLYRITFIEQYKRTESSTRHTGNGVGQNRGYRGYFANHPNVENQPDEAHIYWLAGEFIKDPATTMAMVDDPRLHPDPKFHWLHPDHRDEHRRPQQGSSGTKRSTDPFWRVVDQGSHNSTAPGIMNYTEKTYVLAGAKNPKGPDNTLLQFIERQLGANPSYSITVHDAIMELMRSEMGYVEIGDSEVPSEFATTRIAGTERTAQYRFDAAPVFSSYAAWVDTFNENLNSLDRLFNAASNDNQGPEVADDEDRKQVEEEQKRDLYAEARNEANRNRRALTPTDLQCYLLENIGRLSQREGILSSTYRHCSMLDTNRNPALVLNEMEKRLTQEEAEALLAICPEVQAALVPYFKLYRVDYDRQGKPLVRKGPNGEPRSNDIEFEIPNFISETDIAQITTSGTGRIPGAGMKKFSWSLDGVQPATVDNNITATLELYFQTVNDFFQDTYKAGNPEKPTFLDLIIASPGADTDSETETDDDPGADPGSPAQCTKKIDSQLSERYDGARFRIKAVAGWASPPNLLEMFPSLGKATADALQSALNKQKTTLFLQQTRHDIDFAQDGSLKLTINYQAALTGILTAQSANIFAPRTIATAELESRREVISELEEQAQKSGSTSKDKKALKKALEDYKTLQEQDKLIRYRKLLEGLFCSGKIYNLAIPRTHLLLPPLMDMSPGERAGRAKTRQSSALRITQGGDSSVLLEALATGDDAETVATATSEILTQKYDEIGPGGRAKSIIFGSFFYLGDLIDNVLTQIKLNNNTVKGLDVPFVLSETPMIDPLQAYKIENIEEVVKCTQNLEDAKFIDDLHRQDPFNFPKGVGVIQLINIGDIPISVDAFQVWFKDKVVKPGKSHYYLLHFVKDLCADLISGALTSGCFGGNLKFVQRFDCQPFSLNTKQGPLRPNRHVDLETLRNRVVKVDDSSNTADVRLGLLLMSTDTKPKGLKGMESYADDTASGVYHHYLGSPCGLVKTINFNREDQPYLRESKIQREGSLDASQLRELYSANIELYGNTLYRNGSYIYINPRLLGARDKQLRTLGLHGYYMVTAVKSEISETGFNVSIRALAEGQEFESEKFLSPMVSTAAPIPEPHRASLPDPPPRRRTESPTPPTATVPADDGPTDEDLSWLDDPPSSTSSTSSSSTDWTQEAEDLGPNF